MKSAKKLKAATKKQTMNPARVTAGQGAREGDAFGSVVPTSSDRRQPASRPGKVVPTPYVIPGISMGDEEQPRPRRRIVLPYRPGASVGQWTFVGGPSKRKGNSDPSSEQ